MSCYSASAFTQSAPQVSSDSFSLDDNIRVAANTCKGVEHHVADITALLIKTLGCSVSNEHAVFAERRRKFVQEPLHVFISTIVNEIAQDVLDIGGVIAAAHVLLMHLYISNPLAGASWSGHELFISAFSFAAQEQPASHAAGYIHDYVFWSKLSKFTVEEVMGMQLRLSAQLQGRVWMFSEAMEQVKQSPLMQLQAQWRQEDEEIKLEKRKHSLRGRLFFVHVYPPRSK